MPSLKNSAIPIRGFSSVKLPASLVQQARDAAQPLRRSVAGQIEYWATLGRAAENTGLTVQEVQSAIEGYEAAARQTQSLGDLRQRILAVSTNGSLEGHIRQIVDANRGLTSHHTVGVAPAASDL